MRGECVRGGGGGCESVRRWRERMVMATFIIILLQYVTKQDAKLSIRTEE